MISSLKKLQKGFTLLETLVAIMILMTAIAGPLTIAHKGFNAATVARDEIIAFALAQDALEYIRFARDTNTLGGGDWLTAAGGSGGVNLTVCMSPNTCYLDSTGFFPSTPTACPSGVCAVLRYDTNTGVYQYNNGANTIFTRTTNIVTVNAEEVIASTTVTWRSRGGIAQKVHLFENIFKWQVP